MGKFRPSGAMEVLKVLHSEIRSKKLIGNFRDYKSAKEDVIIEIGTRHKIDFSDIQEVLTGWESICNMEEWFSDLGTPEEER
jgi:hypothetical protein